MKGGVATMCDGVAVATIAAAAGREVAQSWRLQQTKFSRNPSCGGVRRGATRDSESGCCTTGLRGGGLQHHVVV